MPRYLLTYEIARAHPDYPPLIAVLRSLRATRVLPSVWIVESELAAFDVCRHVVAAGCLDPNERILVVALGDDAAWRKLLVGDADGVRLLGREGAPRESAPREDVSAA